MKRKTLLLMAVLFAVITTTTACTAPGTAVNTTLDASNVMDRRAYLKARQKAQEVPLDEKYKGDAALLFEASGPRVRLYVTKDQKISGFQNINEKGADITEDVELKDEKLTEAVDDLTERAVIRGYLSDNNPVVTLSVETADPADPESIREAGELTEAAQKVVNDRLGIHGIEAEVNVSEESSPSEDE